MLLALSSYQLGLLSTAAVFIAFALVVAIVIPRSRPNFPGNRLGVFLGICALLFVAQLTAVLVLAQKGEGKGKEAAATTETTATTSTTPTTTTQTTTGATTTTGTAPAGGQGNPAAGKEVFLTIAQPSCSGCHTLKDAGATGTVGPNLDQLKPTYDRVVKQVTNGGAIMPAFKGKLTEQQIKDVAAYVSSVAGT